MIENRRYHDLSSEKWGPLRENHLEMAGFSAKNTTSDPIPFFCAALESYFQHLSTHDAFRGISDPRSEVNQNKVLKNARRKLLDAASSFGALDSDLRLSILRRTSRKQRFCTFLHGLQMSPTYQCIFLPKMTTKKFPTAGSCWV